MARRISDDELRTYLEATGKPELVGWLLERCQNDKKLRASLLDLVTPKAHTNVLANEIRDRIRQAWQLAKRRDGWKMTLPISRELDQVLVSIRSLMDKGDLADAQKLLVSFVRAAEKGMANIDASNGYLWPSCQQGVTLWGEVWSRIEPRDTKQLAGLVYDQIHDNGYAVKDDMITKFAKALGDEGLRTLQWQLRSDLAALPRSAPGERLPNIERTQIVGWLEEIADASGDVDEYIALVESEGLMQTYALSVSRRLFEAGRLQEALAYLEKGTARFLYGESDDYPTLQSKILIALGRKDEAREILWREFSLFLSTSTFEKILELTSDADKPQARQRAASLAENHRSPEQGAYFLTQMGDLERAAKLVQRKQEAISGSSYDTILKVIEALAEPYPSQAWILYRILLLNILNESRYNAYSHAAKYLMTMQELAVAAGIELQQKEFVQHLLQAHGRKSSFWARVKTDS